MIHVRIALAKDGRTNESTFNCPECGVELTFLHYHETHCNECGEEMPAVYGLLRERDDVWNRPKTATIRYHKGERN